MFKSLFNILGNLAGCVCIRISIEKYINKVVKLVITQFKNAT